MFRRHRHLPVVLAAALLAGQWLSASHESEHALQPGAAHACAACLVAHGAGAGAVPAPQLPALGGSHDVPVPAGDSDPLAVVIRLHPIRGPPALLA